MAGTVHVNDEPTFRGTILDQDGDAVDISGASSKQIVLRKPDGTTKITKSATLTNDGTDGKLEYTAAASELDTEGEWKWQFLVTLGGRSFASDAKDQYVAERL